MARISAVLDTNVVVSSHIKPEGQEALILALALSGKFDFAVSAALLEEYEGVLSRSRFKLSSGIVSATMARIRRLAVSVDPRERLNVTRDPSDNMVLECAVEPVHSTWSPAILAISRQSFGASKFCHRSSF